jgi:hypothetical protein
LANEFTFGFCVLKVSENMSWNLVVYVDLTSLESDVKVSPFRGNRFPSISKNVRRFTSSESSSEMLVYEI